MTPPTHAQNATNSRYLALLRQNRDLIMVMNLDGYYMTASASVADVFGISVEELVQKHYHMMVDLSEVAKADEVYARLIRGEDIPTYERTFLRKDGTPFIGEVNVTLIRDDDGNPHEILSIIRDITERKRLEAKLLERQMLNVQLQKEQEISQMRADLLVKINHQFRTPLAIINTYSSLMERHFDRLSPERRVDYLQNIRNNVHRVSEMLDDLYVIYQTQNGSNQLREALNLSVLIEGVITQVNSSIGGDHLIMLHLSPALPTFYGHERLMWHTLNNLIVNAVRYSPTGSQVTVTVRHVDHTIVLSVADEGMGIAPDDIPHLFEPFFRGNNAMQHFGTGLGLSVVNEAVRAHEGQVFVESILLKGTTITIQLPIVLNYG
ncbi:MAG: PAS domain-containing sensor histidine kinase [Phototrophicales bacterium]|nr:PAS domain-containing sensor histidine kinase [Phototrophicales bacterium]